MNTKTPQRPPAAGQPWALNRTAVGIVHELPGRIRCRLPCLALRGFATATLESELHRLVGIQAVRINANARSVMVAYDGSQTTRTALLSRLSTLVPQAYLEPDSGATATTPPRLAPLVSTGLAILAVPLVPMPLKAWLTVATISPSLYKGAHTVLTRGIKVEVLDALAVGVAVAQGAYFTAGATRLLLAAGEYLDARAEEQAHRLLLQLLQRPPQDCWVERNGDLVRVAASAVRENNRVVAHAGDEIPVDGTVVDGCGTIDQSALTGESVPVAREAGDSVRAGTIVVEGRLVVRAERVGNDTATAQLTRIIEQSLRQPANSQRLAERLGDRLVLLTFALGGLMFALTRDPRRTAAVFLVDYSCALKLGTPLAFISGMHQAAKAGLVFRGAGSLERLAEADTAVFDKTGTLTHSRLEISAITSLTAERTDQELLALVASIEEHSRHPFATAVTNHAGRRTWRHIDHGDVEYVVAHGLSTRIAGQRVQIGSRHYLEAHENIDFSRHEAIIDRLIGEGNALLYVAEQGQLTGLIALRDELREEAAATLSRLRTSGIAHIVVLSGDTRRQAEPLSAILPIDAIYAELTPDEKAERIGTLKSAGHKVVFVGDGVNDAAALVTADVGVAMTDGTLLCREAADLLMLGEGLSGVAVAREIAQGTRRLIDSNFTIDLAVNSALLIGASAGWLPPIACALLHNGTTLAILTRALRHGRAAPHSADPSQRI